MFFGNHNHPDKPAIIDADLNVLTYQALSDFTTRFYSYINKRTLIVIFCEQMTAALAGYVASLSNRVVPLMIAAHTESEYISHILEQYQPEYIWLPTDRVDTFSYEVVHQELHYTLLKTNNHAYPMHEDLSLLLTTSGSTGSPKFVRHHYNNVYSNAKNVASVFALNSDENAMIPLPIQFTQGLNVASSHLFAGATVLLSRYSFIQKEFWTFFKTQKATSLTCVPYSIELLDRLRFFRMDLPDFVTLNQGGGRLSDTLFMKCAQYAADTQRKFVATYGSTETTARMTYLPPDLALEKCGSIGIPIPEGQIELVDADGHIITDSNIVGEIIYYGPNVTMGYALSGEDLIKGDERLGRYNTGDLAYRDDDGCHFIVGRQSRFLKLFGTRVSLDETERIIKDKYSIECACVGNDSQMKIYIVSDLPSDEIRQYISSMTHLNKSVFNVIKIDTIPKNDTGKIMYKDFDQGGAND